jgi:hypothetical protein
MNLRQGGKMQRRDFVRTILPLAAAGTLLAQSSTNPDRLSGIVKSINKEKTSVEISMRKSPNVIRICMWDNTTRFTYKNKPAQAGEMKEGMRIVAVGKFEGINLKAAAISLNDR